MLHVIWWLECTEIDRNHEKPTTTPLSWLYLKMVERSEASRQKSKFEIF